MAQFTLDEFLHSKMKNSYVDHEEFESIYVRSNDIYVEIDGEQYWCDRVIQIANITAKQPGNGAFTRLVEQLVEYGLAIYIENVHFLRFRNKLISMGFTRVNRGSGYHYLYNYCGHISKTKSNRRTSESSCVPARTVDRQQQRNI